MLLERLLHSVEYRLLSGSLRTEISGLTERAECVAPGVLFFCIRGSRTDGHRFIARAIRQKAACVVTERPPKAEESALAADEGTAVVLVGDTQKAMALLAAAFYGYPARRLRLTGITGTKGKTTVAAMLAAMLERAGVSCGTVGTLGVCCGGETLETLETTTPDAVTLHRVLAEFCRRGCTHAILEVSSQSLFRRRVYGITFDVGIFTNLSPDHIGPGEHSSFAEYREWKSTLFSCCRRSVINVGDASWPVMARAALGEKIGYRLQYCMGNSPGICGEEADFPVLNGKYLPEENRICLSGLCTGSFPVGLPGDYNRENALAAVAAAAALGIPISAAQAIGDVRIPGRTEILEGDGYRVVIDYAHNESSMEKLLLALREMRPARLICVYGSGGGRSVLRRTGMGRAGGRLADLSVLTEDNSRDEPPERILAALAGGVAEAGGRFRVIPDRREAIRWAIGQARKGDLIAVIGKGHETYQESGGIRIPFSDREEALLAMRME